MSKHDSYEAWHPGEQERLPAMIARVNGARRMSTPGERLDEQAQAAGKHLAQQAREAESSLTEQIRWAIEHGAEGPDPSVVDTEVMACDYVIYAVFDLVREALLSDEALQAVIDDIAIGDRSLREAMEGRRRRGWTPYSTGAYGTARSYVTAALDAVIGEGK